MVLQSTGPRMLTAALLFLLVTACCCQFPAVCNTPENLASKTCCPNNCGGPTRGICQDVLEIVSNRWSEADDDITGILRMAPEEPEKNTTDSRYKWPTVVFQYVCVCSGNYGGVDCMDCDYGWRGNTCSEKKVPVIRKTFTNLSEQEKGRLMNAFLAMKNEMGIWSVIATEPPNYDSGTVTLQDVSTYDFYIYIHNYVARDVNCREVNNDNIIDFGHSGPSFPVWHTHYLLLLEKDFQRIMGNASFGLPYWQWEESNLKLSPFQDQYFGEYSRSETNLPEVVDGMIINSRTWTTVCDGGYIHLRDNDNIRSCTEGWKLCNPENDRQSQSSALERRYVEDDDSIEIYLPNTREVKIAITARKYDAHNIDNGKYIRKAPRDSFRSRLEGWNVIRSDSEICSGGPEDGDQQHMHNVVHDWVGGHMDYVPAAVNDPIFSLHHCNIDRIIASWMNRSTELPEYEPTSGGHPGHNRDDYLVPFFPLVTAGNRYRRAEELGYTYDQLIMSEFEDRDCMETITEPNVTPTEPNTGMTAKMGLWFGLGLPLLIAVTIGVV